jgi:hypothetical protein
MWCGSKAGAVALALLAVIRRHPRFPQALQQSVTAFAALFNEWRQRAFSQYEAVFEQAAAKSASVEFDDDSLQHLPYWPFRAIIRR